MRSPPAAAGRFPWRDRISYIVAQVTLTLVHLVSLPIDNTSVNPVRSIAAAIYGGMDALAQPWVFLVFPIVGALLAGFAHRALFERTNI